MERRERHVKQECIPVGCVPCAAVTWGRGVSQHALGRGVSDRGVFAQGVSDGVTMSDRGGGCLPSTCWDTCPPVNRIIDACENNLAATTLRTLINGNPRSHQMVFLLQDKIIYIAEQHYSRILCQFNPCVLMSD